MSKEKQIEEMAKDLCQNSLCDLEKWNDCLLKVGEYCAECNRMAKRLYKHGYRKQIEGEWTKGKHGLYVCSVCDKTCPYDAQGDDISYWECKFCPNCGAKMRKEDEGK